MRRVRWQQIGPGEWELCSSYGGVSLDKLYAHGDEPVGTFKVPRHDD